MKFRSTISTAKIEAMKQQLLDAGHEASISYDYEFVYLNTTEAGEKWMRRQLEEKKEIPTKPKARKSGNWFVKDDALNTSGKPEATTSQFIVSTVIMMALLVGVFSFSMGAFDGPPAAPKTWKEANAEKFGLTSEFAANLGVMVDRELVKFPRTKRVEGYRVFTIEPDSVTVVYMYSAENIFGVRSDHSVTVVAAVNTGRVARMVSMQ